MKRLKVLSLAALVAFAACDEGTEPIVAPPVTGTISGVVTIEGTAKSGVSVTLSGGQAATTDASGAYSFAGVAAGNYTVTISGIPADATFSTTAKGATIATSGQVATVNFDGAYVRTSAILGSVAAGGAGLSGVKVALTGTNAPAGASFNTDGNGQYSFTGLRAGTYTLTISGFDATQYTFASSTATVTVAAGQSQVASFNGTKIATAKITGTVTIEGAAAAGVTATLSTGATATTDAAGAYTFSNLTAGTYTVTISGFAADATFTTVAQTVTIATAGSTVPANFAGTYVKTSSILGTVAVAGTGLGGVKVTLNNGATVNTDANGQYAFAALRAGTYTVTISGFDAGMYTFAETAASVTVASGQSAVKSFAGAYVATAKISGSLYIDELPKNDTYDAAEAAYALSGVAISIEGGAVNNIQNTTTDANGAYSFTGLIPGTYRVTITPPVAGTFGYGGPATPPIVVLATGGTKTVDFPFDILIQKVKVSAYLGTDATTAGLPGPMAGAAIPGVQIDLYDTQAHAAAHIGVGNPTTGRIGGSANVTGADGSVTISYTRSLDASPAGVAADNIVYATLRNGTGLVPANLGINGEQIIEVRFDAKDSLVVAGDVFDFLNGNVVLKYLGRELDNDKLAGWFYNVALGDTILGTVAQAGPLNASGELIYAPVVNPAILPQTFRFQLGPVQALAGTHAWRQTPEAAAGTVTGSWLTYVHKGLKLTTDTIIVGTQKVKYLDADVIVRVHNEKDDTLGYTTLDGFPAVFGDVVVQRYNGSAAQAVLPFGIVSGEASFLNTKVDTAFTYRARATIGTIDVLNDTMLVHTLTGNNQADTINVLPGSKGFSSFAFKYNDGGVGGSVLATDGTQANGVQIRVNPAANNIQPKGVFPRATKVTTGIWVVSGLREGPYDISVLDSITAAGDSIWSFLTTAGVATGSQSATRDLSGPAAVGSVAFIATRMDTKVRGVVINDRDADFNTIDPEEALSGVGINLYIDTNADGAKSATDVLKASATTDGNGAYEFTKLREGNYVVESVSPANATVLRVLSATGAVTNTVGVTTKAALGAGATLNQNNTRNVGNTSPPVQLDQLPRWNYLTGQAALDGGTGPSNTGGLLTTNPAHFVHLFATGTATGKVLTNVGALPVVGARVTITRCQTAAAAPSPPAVGACTAKHGVPSPHIKNFDTDATGAFLFSGLLEGVYQVDVAPATAGFTTINTPGAPFSYLLTIQGNNDVETTPNFLIS